MSILNSFSAFGKVTPVKLTVADAVATLKQTLTNLNNVVEQREYAAEQSEAQIRSLQASVEEDRAEVAQAKSVQAKLAALLS